MGSRSDWSGSSFLSPLLTQTSRRADLGAAPLTPSTFPSASSLPATWQRFSTPPSFLLARPTRNPAGSAQSWHDEAGNGGECFCLCRIILHADVFFFFFLLWFPQLSDSSGRARLCAVSSMQTHKAGKLSVNTGLEQRWFGFKQHLWSPSRLTSKPLIEAPLCCVGELYPAVIISCSRSRGVMWQLGLPFDCVTHATAAEP